MILLGISMDDIMALWENKLRENWENNLRERIISERIGRNWENLGEWFYTQGERVKSPVWFHYEINAMKTEILSYNVPSYIFQDIKNIDMTT